MDPSTPEPKIETTPPQDANPASPPAQQATPEPSPPVTPPPRKPKKWYKNLTFVLVLVLLLAAAGAATTWVYTRPDKTPQTHSQNTHQPAETAHVPGPVTIAYSHQTQQELAAGNCTPSTTELYWRPATGGEKATAADIGKNNYISQYGTYKNQVFVVAAPGCGSKDGVAVWLSSDGGKTYQKIYSGKPGTGGDGVLADQVTGAVFSTDGTAIVFGFLPADSDTNIVKSIDIATKKAQDLLTVSSRGVFIASYDHAKQQLIYSKGKYNSDGGGRDTLYIWNQSHKAEDVLYKVSGMNIDQITPNSDSSKLLLVKSTPGEYMGGGKPYVIEELDVASKTSKKLQSIDEDTYIKIGYRIGDDMPYYSRDNTLYGVGSDGNQITLFQTSRSILEVHYVDKDHVIVSTGTDFGDFDVVNYTLSSKSTAPILSGDTFTRVFGTSWN